MLWHFIWICSRVVLQLFGGRRGHDRMVVGFMQIVHITTNVVNSNPVHGEVYSIQHYVINFVSDLRQAGGFLRVLRFLLPIKLIATIQLKYC